MQSLSIRQVLSLLFIVPVLCVAVSLWQLAPMTLGRMHNAKGIEETISLAEVAGNYVHALQRERGSSAGYVSAKIADPALRDALVKLRAESEASREKFEAQLGLALKGGRLPSRVSTFAGDASKLKEEIARLRGGIDQRTMPANMVISSYSKVIASIIENIGQGTTSGAKESIADYRAGFGALMQAKEFAGIERASGNALLSAQAVDPAVAERFIGMGATQAMRLKEAQITLGTGYALIEKHLTPELALLHGQAQGGILLRIHTGGDSGLAREGWWKLSSQRIDALHAAEKDLAARLKEMARAEADDAFNDFALTLALQAAMVLLGVAITAYISHSLSSPIRRAAQALERTMKGEANVIPPPPMPASSEVGQISNAVGAYIAANAERTRLIAEREAAEAAMGETRVRVLQQMETELSSASHEATGTLREAAHTLNTKSAAMLSTVGAVRHAQDEAYAAAESSRGTVSEVSRLSSELAQSIAEIAQQSSRTAQLASEVQTRALASRDAATQFEEVAHAIGSIVDLINAIAGQTNLLALNATIEAARAGEMGKGFAVVAGEVKDLAARTMDATRTIEGKVGELKGIARTAAEQATALSDDVGNIQGLNSAIAAAVHEQHMTSEGFGESINSLANAVSAVVEQVDAIARLGSEAHASAAAVQDVANEMEHTTTTLAETLPRLISDTSRRIAG